MTAPTLDPADAPVPGHTHAPADLVASPAGLSLEEADDLRHALGGQALLAGDPGYDAARFGHNTAYDRRPLAIVRPADPVGVARAIRVAAERDLELAVRGGGHSVAGHSTTDGGLLVDLSAMREVRIDPERRIGVAQGGVTAGEYTIAAHAHGLATPFGDTANVGLGGLTLGGGIGWLARRLGMTIDNLLAVDLVTADGHIQTVTEATDPELFWALRGGGGNFGVATRFAYRLHEVGLVMGGALVLPLSTGVLERVLDAANQAPDELTVIANVMGLPPAPFVPAELVGTPAVIVMPVYAGSPEAGAAAFAPFRAAARPLIDMTGPMPYPAIYQLTEGASAPGPAVVRSSFFDALPAPSLDAIVEAHSSPAGAMAVTQLRVLGGAMGRVSADATAFAHRSSPVMAAVISMVADDYEATRAWTDGYFGQVRTGETGVYANFLGDAAEEGETRVRSAYPDATRGRLAAVKRRVDPANIFRGNHNIAPA